MSTHEHQNGFGVHGWLPPPSIEQQTLHAVLRIEQMMREQIAKWEAQGAKVTRVDDEIQVELPPRGNYEERHTPDTPKRQQQPKRK